MKNIETAIEAIEAEKKLELERMNEYDELITRLKNLQNGDLNHIANSENNPISPGNVQNAVGKKELLKDYPYDKKLSNKLQFLDLVLNRPFRMVNRLELIEELEGKEKRSEYENRISQQLYFMISNMTYIGQKYGSNTKTFYFKKEWAIWNGKEFTIKPEYEITPAEFEAANIPEHKRKDFEWILSKAAKSMSSAQ